MGYNGSTIQQTFHATEWLLLSRSLQLYFKKNIIIIGGHLTECLSEKYDGPMPRTLPLRLAGLYAGSRKNKPLLVLMRICIY